MVLYVHSSHHFAKVTFIIFCFHSTNSKFFCTLNFSILYASLKLRRGKSKTFLLQSQTRQIFSFPSLLRARDLLLKLRAHGHALPLSSRSCDFNSYVWPSSPHLSTWSCSFCCAKFATRKPCKLHLCLMVINYL